MLNTEKRKEHYNLYYIFKEDMLNNTLSKEQWEKIWENVHSAINNIDYKNCTLSPPNKNFQKNKTK